MPRNRYRYDLVKRTSKDSTQIVYGRVTSREPEVRKRERQEGKDFDELRVVGSRASWTTARSWETDALPIYRRGHRGNKPKYSIRLSG